jgi:hypothetical protein
MLIKISVTLFFTKEISGYEDWSIAKNLVNFGEYSEIRSAGQSAIKLPIYPLFLSFFLFIFGKYALFAIVIAQHILYFFIPIGIYRLLLLFNLEKVGIIAGFLFLFSPAYLYYSSIVEATNVFIPISILWAIVLAKIYL